MTTVAVMADPPWADTVFTSLTGEGPLTPEEAADLYAAMLRDACRAVEGSGADLLVNYRVPDDEPEEAVREDVESTVAAALDAPSGARYEIQVGSTHAARVGNTVTHLLEQEAVRSAAALDPRVALLERRHIDSAAMKLRNTPVVVGPAPGGRVWYAAFTDTVDFDDAYAPPVLRTLTERGRAAGHEIDFVERLPVVETPADLTGVLVEIRARDRAARPVPTHTSDALDGLGIDAEATGDGLTVVRR